MARMRPFWIALWLHSSIALAAPPTCPWREPAAPPQLEVKDGAARFSWPLDDAWFSCATARGASMELAFVTLNDAGQGKRAKRFVRATADATETVPVAELCAAAVAKRVRVRVVGTGLMDRLLYETPTVDLPCFSCPLEEWKSSLMLSASDPEAPPGFVSVRGRFDEAFRACATAARGTLAMRVYVGQSEDEASLRRDHSFLLSGLERASAFRKAFAPTNLCNEGKWIGIEYVGTGEFRQLTMRRRHTLALPCPKAL